jgi:histone deacetylase 1/2
VPDAKNLSAAIHNCGVDSNWYTDTDATDHITGELNKLAIHDVYHGNNQIKTASGAGMNISHIGHATISTPSRNLHLKNVLHVPNACKNLVSVHHLASDNNAFWEFHPIFSLIKDQATKHILLRGRAVCTQFLPIPRNKF